MKNFLSWATSLWDPTGSPEQGKYMGTLVAATKIWTGETLTGAAVEGSERALRSPAYGGWWGGGVKMTPPTRPLRRAAQPAGPTASCQASLSISKSWSLPKFMSIESVMPSNHLILCQPLLLWQPTPVFLPGESQGRGSLVGCPLWGRTESDTTEVT